ncbi:MAG: hypothetical protein J0626_09835, partial [Rhodospirillaceae bacterium]|nr:hypothetical protein [Rhodospirillaceae bacterium]
MAAALMLVMGGSALTLPVLAATMVALAAGLSLIRRCAGAPHATLAAALAGSQESESRAVLVIGRKGEELFRNQAARRILSGAADPLANLKCRADGDDRTLAEIERLDAAAAVGAPRRTEVALATAGGGREWFALEVKSAGPG